jgi:aryl-alcohol dehydrogenase-like predicted oxidoreductase
MIPSHKLGKNGPSLPAISYGAMGLGHDHAIKNPTSQEEKFDLLDAVVSNGVAMIDTADAYGPCEDIASFI